MSSYCLSSPLPNAVWPNGFCAFALPVAVNGPRMVQALATQSTSDVLILESRTSSICMLHDTNGDSVPDTKIVLASAPGLNHGLEVHNQYLYASSSSTVFRWGFDGYFDNIDDTYTIVIDNINASPKGNLVGAHVTRTLAFDKSERLYVSVGSMTNVDDDSSRARLRRFNISNASTYPIDFTTGQVFADGLRNEVGLAFDRHGVLWGVENSADNVARDDLGGDIHDDNPAEELNQFTEERAGAHYGYPFCWTEFKLPTNVGQGRGAVWAWPEKPIDDATCRNSYQAPALAMQAHSAPLGITFYRYRSRQHRPPECTGGFPKFMDGYAFIAFHGSWDRTIPTGYKVVYVPMDKEGKLLHPEASPVDLLTHIPPNAQWEDGFRPVDVDFDGCGRLLVTSDGGGSGSKVVRIEYTADNNACRTQDCSETQLCCLGTVCKNGRCKACRTTGVSCTKNKQCCSKLCDLGTCS